MKLQKCLILRSFSLPTKRSNFHHFTERKFTDQAQYSFSTQIQLTKPYLCKYHVLKLFHVLNIFQISSSISQSMLKNYYPVICEPKHNFKSLTNNGSLHAVYPGDLTSFQNELPKRVHLFNQRDANPYRVLELL